VSDSDSEEDTKKSKEERKEKFGKLEGPPKKGGSSTTHRNESKVEKV
jgi:hypothetical protein